MNMDLWDTLDNHQEKQEQGAGAGEPSRVLGPPMQKRRLTEAVVLSVVREWLLRDYVSAYCRSLASIRIFRRCYWVDGLGVDARSGESLRSRQRATLKVAPTEPSETLKASQPMPKGVPRVMEPIVELGGELVGESRPIMLHGLVLKGSSSRHRKGREQPGKGAIAVKLPEGGGVVDASWLEAAPAILQAIEQAPAMFLLNPFGQTLFSYDDLAPLYQRTGPTELFLLLSHRQLASHLLTASADSTGASTLTALLRSDRWKSLPGSANSSGKNGAGNNESKGEAGLLQQGQLKSSLSMLPSLTSLPEQAIDGLLDLFIASMKARFLTVQRIALPVQVGPAAVEQAPYTLLFATRRQDSLAMMNDAVCAYQRRVSRQSYQGVLGEEWFAQQERELLAAEQHELERLVATLGSAQRPRRWPELRQHLLLTRFGRWPLQEYDGVMCQLLKNGTVRCEWRRKPVSSGATNWIDVERVPGDEDILLWK